MIIEKKLEELGIELPEPPTPVASYTSYKIVDKMLYISGQGPVINGEQLFTGKVGSDCTLEDGYQSARYCGYNLLAQMKKAVGDLDNIKQIVHLKGFVASADDFFGQPQVINGASDLMLEIFGEAGIHTRCALGVNVLPTNITTEVEIVAELK